MLGDIARLGPEVLLNVTELYAMCVDCGLIPAYPLHTLVELLSQCCAYDMMLSLSVMALNSLIFAHVPLRNYSPLEAD